MFSTVKYWFVNSQYSRENRSTTLYKKEYKCWLYNFDHYLHTMYAHAWYIQSRYFYIRTQGRAGKPTAA